MPDKLLKEYLDLRNEVDERCKDLWKMHSGEMQCESGCASCCQSFRILPVEYYSIKGAIENKNPEVNTDATDKECRFLVDNKCSIYEHRPVICRTHGYPFSRLNEEVEAYEVSFCPLNFKDYNFENFNYDNLFPEDEYNSKLFVLNKKFIAELQEEDYDSLQLVELNNLAF